MEAEIQVHLLAAFASLSPFLLHRAPYDPVTREPSQWFNPLRLANNRFPLFFEKCVFWKQEGMVGNEEIWKSTPFACSTFVSAHSFWSVHYSIPCRFMTAMAFLFLPSVFPFFASDLSIHWNLANCQRGWKRSMARTRPKNNCVSKKDQFEMRIDFSDVYVASFRTNGKRNWVAFVNGDYVIVKQTVQRSAGLNEAIQLRNLAEFFQMMVGCFWEWKLKGCTEKPLSALTCSP